MNRGNRQILINPHSSIEKVPAGALNLGEIAVQHNNVEDAALYVETVQGSESGETVAKFITDKAIERLITSAQTDLESLINALSAGTIQLSGDVVTYVNELSAGTLEQIERLDESIGLPNTGNPYFDESQSVWSAINQTYEALIASAAAATTTVVSADTEDTEKYLTLTSTLDPDTDSRTYTIGLDGIGEAIESAHTIAMSAVTVLSAGTIQLSADTEAAIEKLSGDVLSELTIVSGIVDTFSAETVAEFTSAFTAIQNLSGNVDEAIKALDVNPISEAGKPITAVSETDGLVSASAGTIDAEYVNIADAGELLTATTVEGALQEIATKVKANEISNDDGSINVTTAATGTDINVNIKSGEKVLAKDGAAGLYTDIKLSGVTPSSTTVKEEYALYATDGSVLGDHIKIYKDSSLVSITLEDNDGSGHTGQYLKYTYIDASGDTQSTYVDVSALLVEAEFASGVTADQSGIVHGVVDPTTEKDRNGDAFLTVGADGFKVDGIKDEIDTKIAALDKTDDVAVAGQYVAAIEETDGVVAVKTRANVSEAVLNNYAKGSDATPVAAADTVNQAISKLENQIDAAKAAATTKVVEGTDNAHLEITSAASQSDSSVTYTVTLTDVASDSALTAEIAARKAVDGQNGDTYAANTGAKYISGATNLNDADVKLDTALAELEAKVGDMSVEKDSASTENFVKLTVANDGQGATAITINDTELKTKIDAICGTTSSSSAETSLWGIKNLIEEMQKGLVDDIDADEVLIHSTVSSGADCEKYVISASTKLQNAVASAETAPQSVVFEAINTPAAVDGTDHVQSMVNAKIEGQTLKLDMRYLRIDCGEY